MREKRIRAQDKNEPIFDYDLNSTNPNEPLIISFEGLSDPQLESYTEALRKDAAFGDLQKNHLQASATKWKQPRPIAKSDPLKPELFIGHHRRMEREERRMQVQERQGLMTTALRLKTQKELLTGPDWKRYVEKIIRIDDPLNSEEIRRKRELALADMTTFLSKFDEYHRRFNRRDSRKDRNNNKLKKPPSKAAVSKPTSNQKLGQVVSTTKKPDLPSYEPPKGILIGIRPCAFGFMLPPRIFPPREFQLPKLLRSEVESYDLVEMLRAKRPKPRAKRR